MKGTHVHEWKYNEAKIYPMKGFWFVIRFCPECKKVERLELNRLED